MKTRLPLLVLFMMLFNRPVLAQLGNGHINGTVVDPKHTPLAGATVILCAQTDTTIRQTRIAGQSGAFIFERLAEGNYVLRVTCVGYYTFDLRQLMISKTQPSLALPAIILQPNQRQSLKEITISAKKPLIEQRIDRTIVNVDAMLSASGGNALEALSKSPGVMVDLNDDISLNGKRNVLVLIDGRPTYMSGADLAAYLRSLPAGMLDQFELITNPPAQYDATGGAVINIILKKNRAQGFNGGISLAYNQGKYARSNNALNLNYHNSNFNLFGNLSYSLDQNYSAESYSRFFDNPDGSLNNHTTQNSFYHQSSNGFNGRVGLDFSRPNTTFGLMLTGNTRPKNDRLSYTNQMHGNNQLPDSSATGNTDGQYTSQNINLNLNLLHKFDKQGTQVTADLDAVYLDADGNQQSDLTSYQAGGVLSGIQQRIFLTPGNTRIYAAKSDFTHPLSGKAEFTAGIKSSMVINDNALNWFNQSSSVNQPDYSKSNRFRYAENINAVYLNLKKSWKQLGFQAGLRLENTNASGHQFGNILTADSVFTRHYTNVFPSVYLSYKLDSAGHSRLTLSYSQKIRRPGYQQLNPFLFYRDQYSYTTGNLALVPTPTNGFGLQYNFRQYVSISAGYGWGNNQAQLLTQALGNVLITRPYNFINNQNFAFVPYVSFDPLKWWTLHANAVLIYIINKGSAQGVRVDQRTNIHEIETSNEFRIGPDWSAELDGFFPGKQSFGQQAANSSVYNISAALRKNMLKGQGSFTLTINDLLNTFNRSQSQTIGIDRVAAFSTKETDIRRIGLAFSYRFGKQANARKRDHNNGGAEDEKGRTN
ncbi:hypothetical protein BEL04_05365 [Mucilaginibacter sp. PPCGB 2223]|uniref:TonB-dependent receptor domain-containing protein n=1 Tax=Mucilaginibacter sp. PPCGB 2223 TaxID=1886027 RepID=UPI000826A6D6|nr:TonB-dependent receptor [Mucilaginibacter sp. PPCGB 2223]OCX53721.1 hypothetical protein BEL04_05365 [Mucilaginibacter sp. PPCGB 2223]